MTKQATPENAERRNPELTVSRINQWVDASFSSQLDLLRESVAQNSFTKNIAGVNVVQDQLARELRALGLEVQEYPVPERGRIIVAQTKSAAEQGKPILLCGHADTVHSPEDMTENFQELVIEGDKARGPGAYDMKAGNAVIIQALRGLKELDSLDAYPLRILFNSTEEDTVEEARAIIRQLSSDCSYALLFEFGRTDETGKEVLITARKGGGAYQLTVKGIGGHAAKIHTEGRSASVALARRILAIEAAIQDKELKRTINFGTLSAGNVTNSIPEKASTSLEIRSIKMGDLEAAKAQMKELLKRLDQEDGCISELLETKETPPMEQSARSAVIFLNYQRSAMAFEIELCEGEVQAGQSDGNHIASAGIPVLDALGPLGNGAHTHDEWVSLRSLRERTAVLIDYLLSNRKPI
jgi:glutamate carboxypeptidase